MLKEKFPPAATAPVDDVAIGDVLTLYSLNGMRSPNSLQFSSSINSTTFSVIIDNGSTHNFIQLALVEELQIPILNVA